MTPEHPVDGASQRKTPEEASEFEREQLRFLLSGDDVAATLAHLNPSLAWLPVLQQMQVIRGENQLVPWIERNFSDVRAVRDVIANLRFFGPEAGTLLEYRLNKTNDLPPLLRQCWRLIIRYLKEAKQGLLQNDWFEIAPQIARGDHSPALLERLADVLRPKLRLSKRLSLYGTEKEQAERPSDLMSIDYEVEDGLSLEEVLQALPIIAAAETDAWLLNQLTVALNSTLADATDVGVENNEGYGVSDSDVPSVAAHPQNTYRSGFHVIVRVMAELWLRLARKSPELAMPFVELWRNSNFRLMHRLALFACADPIISPVTAAETLMQLPQRELFLSSSTVEIYRLIRARWKEFPVEKQRAILHRFCEGPKREWFREAADIESVIDRCCYDILAEMKRDGFELTEEAASLLEDICERWPEWRQRPAEQAGFHIWHSGGARRLEGDINKLAGVSDTDLVSVARKLAEKADFMDGDNWQALCLSDPDRALRGLNAATKRNDWSIDFWQQLLWARKKYQSADTEIIVATLLLQWPPETFYKIATAASSWLNENFATLDETLLWALWEKIALVSLVESPEINDA